MAANMDTVGTFEVAEVLARHGMITCLHKHYSIPDAVNWGSKVGPEVLKNVAVSTGTSDRDFGITKEILDELKDINFICLDVANGY